MGEGQPRENNPQSEELREIGKDTAGVADVLLELDNMGSKPGNEVSPEEMAKQIKERNDIAAARLAAQRIEDKNK